MSAINILTEDLLTLKQAAKAVPRPKGRKPVHYATIYRWVNTGVRGTKLETIKIGQQYMTSVQRIHAFLEATQEA